MAKKSNGLSFKDISGYLDTISKKTSIQIETDSKKKRTYIDTGIYILNALLSKSIKSGGVSKNRISIFAGPTGVGKSYLCYNIARNAQKEGYNIFFIDTEYSTELQDFEDFGINTEKNFALVRSNKVEDIKLVLTQFLDKLKEQKIKGVDIGKNLIFMDSIGQLASNKEVADALDGKHKADMSRAKAIKSLFRIINSDLGFLEIPLICTNHVYMTMDLFPQAKMSGGEGANYSASTIVYLTNAKLKTGQEDDLDLGSSGVIVTAKARKNRLAKPKKIKFEINHSKGTNAYKGLEFFCTPDNFEKIGIAKLKPIVDKKTGEITYQPTTRWYVKHLDKSFYEKQLFTKKVFTDEVLDALEPIIYEYFSYASYDEIQETIDKLDEDHAEFEEDVDFDIDSDDDNQLFN